MFGLLSGSATLWLAIAGALCALFGAKKWAGLMAAPAFMRFVIGPITMPLVDSSLAFMERHWLVFAPVALFVLILAPIFLVLTGLRLLSLVLGSFVGSRASASVTGTLSLRFIDWITGRRRGRPIPDWDAADDHRPSRD